MGPKREGGGGESLVFANDQFDYELEQDGWMETFVREFSRESSTR